MKHTLVFTKRSRFPCSAEQLFAWHEAPEAFSRLMPHGEPVHVLHHDGRITNGARAVLQVGYWPFRLRWELMHENYQHGRQFCDVQTRGPFRYYRHEHVFLPVDENNCELMDRITFVMPLGIVGYTLGRWLIMAKFRRLFDFRHRVTRQAFAS
ncbi:MAG TPA: SRPBCC family protein [Kiritimatiellia bacterium]|nr:SRPBCC family protein [Kiritimatiellia bacterium]HMP00054.1 SRPBCC family protein [Kiritimatiellia bacterium]